MKRILILHGWGGSSRLFQEIKSLLGKEGFVVQVPDLPGFGSALPLRNPMTFGDYLTFIKKLVGGRRLILLGHSFGGRLAIRFSALHPDRVEKLIITGASGFVHPLTTRQKLAFLLAKAGKLFKVSSPRKLLYYFAGEWDYYKSGKLANTFKNVYTESIEDDLPKISIPALLVWGENDRIIPVSDGELMQNAIRGSKLIIVKGATHKLPYEMPHVFVEQILPFLKS